MKTGVKGFAFIRLKKTGGFQQTERFQKVQGSSTKLPFESLSVPSAASLFASLPEGIPLVFGTAENTEVRCAGLLLRKLASRLALDDEMRMVRSRCAASAG